MAGIGFKLQRFSEQGYMPQRMRSNAYTLFIAAGPWILSAVFISLIRFMLDGFDSVSETDRRLFLVTVTYCFIFSQIISGCWQLTVAKFTADAFDQNQFQRIKPAFIGVSKLVFGLSAIAALLFFIGSPLSIVYKLVAALLFFMLGQIWLAIMFLTAAKQYKAIIWPLLLGGAISAICTALLSAFPLPFETNTAAANMLIGFTAGIAVAMIVLVAVLPRFFPSDMKANAFLLLHYVDKYPSLLALGFLFNVGVWIGDIIVWFGKAGMTVENTFRYCPISDNAVFLSVLTIIPTAVLFVFFVESQFYDKYQRFYGMVTNGGTLDMIERSKTRMVESLRRRMLRLTWAQGSVTLLFIIASDYLPGLLRQPANVSEIFRMCVLGAMLNSVMLICIMIMLSFEDRKGAVIAAALFCGCNVLLTAGLLLLGGDNYGLGYFLASLAAFAWGGFRLVAFVRRIEVNMLCSQGFVDRAEST